MDLRRDLMLTVGVLAFLNVCLAFGAIGLFGRMGPAIERIMNENVYSIMALEEVTAELALTVGGASEESRERVRQALQKARDNITEEEERPLLDRLARTLPAALDGDPNARQAAVADIRGLIRINRDAMRKVDAEARRLGSAGGWAAVFVGFLSFLLSIFLAARLQNRFVRPLIDLHDVLEGAQEGDRFRRCRLSEAPREVLQVSQAVNRLLDERLKQSAADATGPPRLAEDPSLRVHSYGEPGA